MEIFFAAVINMKTENGIFQAIALMAKGVFVIHILVSGKGEAGEFLVKSSKLFFRKRSSVVGDGQIPPGVVTVGTYGNLPGRRNLHAGLVEAMLKTVFNKRLKNQLWHSNGIQGIIKLPFRIPDRLRSVFS